MSFGWDSLAHPRVLALPMKVYWAGWESSTLELQQAGWKLSMVQNPMNDSLTLAIQHDQLNMRGITPEISFHHRNMTPEGKMIHAPCRIAHMGHTIMVQQRDWGGWDFHPIDARPQMSTWNEFKSLDDMCHFPKLPLVSTQAIVVPEATVDELLSRILDKQQGAKTDYFRDLVAREGSIVPAHKFHAQIISIKDAA